MAFWSSERLIERGQQEKLISPFLRERVRHGAYELSLGMEVFVTSRPGGPKLRLQTSEHVNIPPGQFALLHTAEVIRVPADAIGLISIKAGVKLKGLVNISGFHVDPGYQGQLVFSVHNAGGHPVRLSCSEPVFLIWFCNLTDTTRDLYNGTHRDQCGLSAKVVTEIDGEIVAPQVLLERVKELERTLAEKVKELEQTTGFHDKLIWGTLVAVIVGVIAAVFVLLADRYSERRGGAEPPVATAPATKP